MSAGPCFRVALVGAGAVALLGGLLSCDTVDLGTVPPGVNACRPSQSFFIQRIWPEFLTKDFGGKRCGDSSCHDAASPRVLKLPPPSSAATLPLPSDWLLVYTSAAEQMSCTDAGNSVLLNRPSSNGHGGGRLFEPNGPEAMLLREWVAAP
jgi:hypothetical protein